MRRRSPSAHATRWSWPARTTRRSARRRAWCASWRARAHGSSAPSSTSTDRGSMSTVLEQRGLPETRARWMPWLALAIGLAALYGPTYLSLAQGLWRDEDYAHGPIILAVFAFLVWRERAALAGAAPPAARGARCPL